MNGKQVWKQNKGEGVPHDLGDMIVRYPDRIQLITDPAVRRDPDLWTIGDEYYYSSDILWYQTTTYR